MLQLCMIGGRPTTPTNNHDSAVVTSSHLSVFFYQRGHHRHHVVTVNAWLVKVHYIMCICDCVYLHELLPQMPLMHIFLVSTWQQIA